MAKTMIVAGAGKLGCRAAEIWRGLFPEAKIYLKTKSDNPERSQIWKDAGYESFSEEKPLDVGAPFVIFSAPPSENYGQQALSTIQTHWDSSSKDSCFVFTSSGGVYSENDGGTVNELSEVKDTDYVKGILLAEQNVLSLGGSVIRFGGLYTLKGGAHNFWITSGRSPFSSSKNGFINLIHYDDGADAVVQLLLKGLRKEIYLLSDGIPVTREEICQSALKNPMFSTSSMPVFQESNVDGKTYDSSKFKKSLNWNPKFPSFDKFMQDLFKDEKVWKLI